MKTSQAASYARYLPVEPEVRAWGLHVLDCGYAFFPPDAPYPASGHPAEYQFTWDEGRTLSEFQVLLITEGAGEFESASGGRHRIVPGHAFLLFPGEWHRYRPSPQTGWREFWVGFDGRYAHELMRRSFRTESPMFPVAQPDEVRELVGSITELMQTGTAGYQQIMAARTVEILARIRIPPPATDGGGIEQKIHIARMALLENAAADHDLEALAQRLGMSYSSFRSCFRKHTGSSPRQYQLQIRTNRAKALLAQTDLSVAKIAEQVGFSSLYYFSRYFKEKTGVSPTTYRARVPMRGSHPPTRRELKQT